MDKKIFSDIRWNTLITLSIGILGFISNRVFSEYMGIDTLGLMRLFSQMVAYLSIVEMGLGTASTYALYKPLLEEDYKRVSIVVSTFSFFYKKIAGIILLLGLGANIFLPFLLSGNIDYRRVTIYWSLYVINTAMGYTLAKYSILFTANQEYNFVRKTQGMTRILFQSLQIIFLMYIQSFILYISILILENIFNLYFYRRHYRRKYSFVVLGKEKDLTLVKDIKNLFWHKMGKLIVNNTDYILIAKFTTLATVGIYSSYIMIYSMIMTLIGILTPVLVPYIGKYIAGNSEEKIYSCWKKLYFIYMFLGTNLVFITYRLINPFVKLWLGEEYLLPKGTVVLIMINLFIGITRQITEVFKENSGFFEDIYIPIAESILNLTISLTLVSKLGLDGVILGTVCSNVLVVYLWKPILIFKRCFKKDWRDYFKNLWEAIFRVGISIGISNLILNSLMSYMSLETWIGWLMTSLITGSICFVIAGGVFATNPELREYKPFFQ